MISAYSFNSSQSLLLGSFVSNEPLFYSNLKVKLKLNSTHTSHPNYENNKERKLPDR